MQSDRVRSKCHECFTGKHRCFICQKDTNRVVKCSEQNCGKFYHLKCIQGQNYPHKIIDRRKAQFQCPLHFCLTCFNEHSECAIRKELVICVKCPTAYHAWDACIAAGSHYLGQYFLCPEHPKTKGDLERPAESRNVLNWCFSCKAAGDLVCCAKCPAAKHQQCIVEGEGRAPRAGGYRCPDCRTRKQLHYGDIVWVKVFSLRWWPAQIVAMENVPDNILKLPHLPGDFPVYFFGTHDYYWMSRSNTILYQDGHEKRRQRSLRSGHRLDKKFKLALEEAPEAYKVQQQKKQEWRSRIRESGRRSSDRPLIWPQQTLEHPTTRAHQ